MKMLNYHFDYNKKKKSSETSFSLRALRESFTTLTPNQQIKREYVLETFQRSNQDTCLIHKPSVDEGSWVQSGDLLTDCASSSGGELSLGQNLLIAYMPWEGYNFEDAILISERLVIDDLYTSIHIERYELETIQNKLGGLLPPKGRAEEITRHIPNISEKEIANLDSFGIIKLGSWVEEGDILVGKTTPINKKNISPYQKLLYTILEKNVQPLKDSSLRAPKGIKAKVIDIKLFLSKPTKGPKPNWQLDSYEESYISSSPRKTTLPRFAQEGAQEQNNLTSQNNLTEGRSAGRSARVKQQKGVCISEGTVEAQVKRSTQESEEALPWMIGKKQPFAKREGRHPFFYKRGSQKNKSETDNTVVIKRKQILREQQSHINLLKMNKLFKKIRYLINERNSFRDIPHFSSFLQPSGLGSGVDLELKDHKRYTSFKRIVNFETTLQNVKNRQKSSQLPWPSKGCEAKLKKKTIPARLFCEEATPSAEQGYKKHKALPSFSTPPLLLLLASRRKKQRDGCRSEGRSFQKQNLETIHIYLAEKRKIQVGDKMSGRHGNKGIVSQILPIQDMPYLPDGTPIDMVLNPLGVPSRMNVGQIFECLLGLAGKYLGETFKVSSFDEMFGPEASRSFVFNKLYEARSKTGFQWLFDPNTPGKIRLYDGRNGETFDQKVTVGQAYMLRLVHMVDDKIHMRSTGPYSLVTQQPLRGRSKQGGQRLGEMEVWALEGYGAAFTLLEMLTIKSDDMTGRMTLWSNLILNKDISIGTPESFKVLICELQALCLDIGLFRFQPSSTLKKDFDKLSQSQNNQPNRDQQNLREINNLINLP